MNNSKTSGLKKTLIILGVILAVVVIVGLNVFNTMNKNGTFLRAKTALKTEHYEVNATMMKYFTGTAYQQLASYLSYFGVDTSKSLDEQECSISSTEGATWGDYFRTNATSNAKQILALCEYAYENNITTDADDLKVVAENIDSLKAAAKEVNYPVDTYVKLVYGDGVTVKDIEDCIKLSVLAEKASNAYTDGEKATITDDVMEAYYNENTADFLGVDYCSYTVDISTDEETEEVEATEETEETAEVAEVEETEEAAEAENTEETIETVSAMEKIATVASLRACTTEEDFKTVVKAYMTAANPDTEEATIDSNVEAVSSTHKLASDITVEEVAEWAFSAEVGETYVYSDLDNGTETVYLLTATAYRDETENETRNVRHILFSNETYTDDVKANEVYEELKAADFSEDKWKELAAEYSSDSGSNTVGGLYEGVSNGDFVSEFNDWLFDSARVENDSDIIETSYGWHIVQYVGSNGSRAAWKDTAESAILSDRYEALITELSEGITTNDAVIAGITM